MKKKLIIVISLFLVFSLVEKSNAQSILSEKTEHIKSQVDSVFQEMLNYAEKLDFDKLSSGVDDSQKCGFISIGVYYADYASLIKDVKTNARGISHQDITLNDKNISVLSDEIVLVNATGISKSHIDDGRVIAASFQWTFVYKKIDNHWKVITSHQSIKI